MSDAKFAEGMYFNLPHENAPEFVKGALDVIVEPFVKWLEENKDESGRVKIDLKVAKSGKPYAQKNDWKPDGSRRSQPEGPPDQDIPW